MLSQLGTNLCCYVNLQTSNTSPGLRANANTAGSMNFPGDHWPLICLFHCWKTFCLLCITWKYYCCAPKINCVSRKLSCAVSSALQNNAGPSLWSRSKFYHCTLRIFLCENILKFPRNELTTYISFLLDMGCFCFSSTSNTQFCLSTTVIQRTAPLDVRVSTLGQ